MIEIVVCGASGEGKRRTQGNQRIEKSTSKVRDNKWLFGIEGISGRRFLPKLRSAVEPTPLVRRARRREEGTSRADFRGQNMA
jgi:hypothetical protein